MTMMVVLQQHLPTLPCWYIGFDSIAQNSLIIGLYHCTFFTYSIVKAETRFTRFLRVIRIPNSAENVSSLNRSFASVLLFVWVVTSFKACTTVYSYSLSNSETPVAFVAIAKASPVSTGSILRLS